MSRLSELVGNLNDRPCRVIEIPGREGEQVGLWCLTLDEEERARKRAYKFVREDLGFNAVDLEYDENLALLESKMCEILADALRRPEETRHHEPFADSAIELRQRLGSHEIQALGAKYAEYVAERSIIKDVADPEKEFDELLEIVRGGYPLEKRLSRYASPSLRLLLLTALDRCETGTMPNASAGSEPSTLASG